MRTLKEFGCFFALVAYIVGALGGLGYACYNQAYFIAICIVVLAGMATPTAVKMFKYMMETPA